MRSIKHIVAKIILLLSFIFISGYLIASQPPPPPGGTGLNGNQGPGGTAPLGEGLVALLVMGAGYGMKKVYSALQEKKNRQ
jgi:hypothetical protein